MIKTVLIFFFGSCIAWAQGTTSPLDLLDTLDGYDQQASQFNDSCMSEDELRRLNQIIVCQQMANPQACDEISTYLRREQSLVSQLETSGVRVISPGGEEVLESRQNIPAPIPASSNNATALTASAIGVGVESAIEAGPRLRDFIWLRIQNSRLGNMMAAIGDRVPTATELTTIRSHLTEFFRRGSRYFPHLRGLTVPGDAALRQMIATAGQRAARAGIRAGAIAGQGVRLAGGAVSRVGASLLTGPVAVGLLMYEIFNLAGRAWGGIYSAQIDCRASDRQNYIFMCVTERCQNHFSVCNNHLGFVMMGDMAAQSHNLANNPQLCSHMREMLNVGNVNLNSVMLNSCPRLGEEATAANVTVENFQHPALVPSRPDGSDRGVPDWVPPPNEPQTVNFKMYFQNGRLTRALSNIDMQRVDRAPRTGAAFNYDASNGELRELRAIDVDPMTVQAVVDNFSGPNDPPMPYIPIEDFSAAPRLTRADLIPPDNVGLFALQGNNLRRNLDRHQMFIFQGQMSQIYHEVRRCCYPQAGETCQLQRAPASVPSPGTAPGTVPDSAT